MQLDFPPNAHGQSTSAMGGCCTNLDEAEVAEAGDDLDAVPLGQLLDGAAELGALQVRRQAPDLVPVGRHLRFRNT